MAVHIPGRPKLPTSNRASLMRTTQILPRFIILGTKVSPVPRSAPAATMETPYSGSASNLMCNACAASAADGEIGRQNAEYKRAHRNIIKVLLSP